jgi:outer membrane immunogenic protein
MREIKMWIAAAAATAAMCLPFRTASAADLDRSYPAGFKDGPMVEVMPNWSGAYAGAEIGFGWGTSDAQEINGPRDFKANFDGAVGGGYFGWRRQFGSWVAGPEIGIGSLGLGHFSTHDTAGGTISSGASFGTYASFSGTFGMPVEPSWLLYGRAGAILSELNGKTTQSCTDGTLCNGAQSTTVSEAKTASSSWGLLLGGGVEHRLDERWSARLEYRFIDFGKELALPAIDGPGWNNGLTVQSVNFGLSYRF